MTTQLYRHFDSRGKLLYVGVSLAALLRLRQHKNNAQWFADIARVEIQHLDDREAALQAEKDAIKREQPAFNVMHNKVTKSAPALKRQVVREPVAAEIRHKPQAKWRHCICGTPRLTRGRSKKSGYRAVCAECGTSVVVRKEAAEVWHTWSFYDRWDFFIEALADQWANRKCKGMPGVSHARLMFDVDLGEEILYGYDAVASASLACDGTFVAIIAVRRDSKWQVLHAQQVREWIFHDFDDLNE